MYQACVLGVYLDEELSEWAKTLDFEALAGEEGGRMGRRFTKYCQSLHATEEELALFSAMVIFQSGLNFVRFSRLKTDFVVRFVHGG